MQKKQSVTDGPTDTVTCRSRARDKKRGVPAAIPRAMPQQYSIDLYSIDPYSIDLPSRNDLEYRFSARDIGLI